MHGRLAVPDAPLQTRLHLCRKVFNLARGLLAQLRYGGGNQVGTRRVLLARRFGEVLVRELALVGGSAGIGVVGGGK